MAELPTGTVTFLFTDLEGSTRLLQRLGPEYARVLGEHQHLLRAAVAAHGGAEVDTQGDAFFVSFPSAAQAVAAAADATCALAEHTWPQGVTVRVRMGLHTGAPALVGDHYVGLDVHRAARIAAAGHGGQVLLSAATAELVRGALPTGSSLRDLGAHRLKDLQQSERLTQLVLPGLQSDFPPLTTLDTHPHNLAIQPTPLLGREQQVAALCQQLRHEEVRLLTLTGPGGIGKTRLAVQVAAELVGAFADGVYFVRLSRLVDPALVVPTIAHTLGLKESGSQPLSELLREHLAARQLLVVLDNFEQVVGAATEVSNLLSTCAGLKVLVTSRVALHLRAEREYALAPLSVPDPRHLPELERLSQYAAVALFVERAQAVKATFAVTAANAPAIAEICARLDGLPLAIELAASRVRVLSPEALLARLATGLSLLTGGARDLEERQQTMRAAIAWSEDLLGPQDRVLFRRLAVFAGGCSLEAAEAVCLAPDGAEPLGMDVFDGLSTLVEQCLVQQREEAGEPRFGMLHVVQEYALERLKASGEVEPLRRAHATYFVALAERVEPELTGPRVGKWYIRLGLEHDNLRAVLAWADGERGEVEAGLRLGAALWRYHEAGGHLSEARAWLGRLLAAASDGQAPAAVAPAVRSRAAFAAGILAADQEAHGMAVTYFESSLEFAREAGDLQLEVAPLNGLAEVAAHQGDLDGAAARHAEARDVARRVGDRIGAAMAQGNLAFIAYYRGDLEAAAQYGEEPVAFFQEGGFRLWHSMLVALAGCVERKRGNVSEAHALQRDALSEQRALGELWAIPETLYMLAATVSMRGNGAQSGAQSARLLGAATALCETLGSTPRAQWRTDAEAAVAPARAALGEEAWAAAFAAGQALSLEAAIALALEEVEVGEVGVMDGWGKESTSHAEDEC